MTPGGRTTTRLYANWVCPEKRTKKKTSKITTKKTDWRRYPESIEKTIKEEGVEFLNELTNEECAVEDRYNGFTFIIREAVAKITPNSGGKRNRNKDSKHTQHHKQPKKWWDIECQEAIDQRKKALQEFRENKNRHNFIKFKKCKAIATKIIEDKKKKSFEAFSMSINKFSNITYVWNTIRALKNNEKLINWNRWVHKNREEEIKKEIENLAPPAVETQIELQNTLNYN